MTYKLFRSKLIRPILMAAIRIISLLLLVDMPIMTIESNGAVLAQDTWWQPNASAPIHWQWQIGTPFNVSTDLIPNVTVYDIDAFDTSASVVASLHTKGYIVIAYASFGTYENWRPDAASFPASVKGSGNGWPGEKWLDIRSDAVKTIMAARLDLIKSKGFDAVEPDNIDGYSNSTGFPLTAQDQLNFNEWIAAQCHQRGLSVGLKNDVDQVSALQPYFDWTLNEESYKYSEYSGLSAFTSNNKAVFEVEYGKSTAQANALNALHFNSMTRDLDLVSPASSGYVRLPCIPDTQHSWTQNGGGAAKLAFTTQPGTSNTVATAFGTQPVVTVEDAGGNVVNTSNASVTLSITAGTGTNGASLSGTATVAAVNGVAVFNGLSINLAGTGYILTATSAGLTNAVSNALAVSAAALDHITVSPTNPSVSMSGNQTYIAQGFDAANNAVSGLSYTWSCTNATAGTINSSGVFTAGTAAGSYPNVIQAVSGGKTGTASVTVTARGAAKLAFTTQPGTSNTVATAFGTQPVVTVEDAGGNVVNTSNASVTLSITAGTGTNGASLSGTATVAAVNGVAVFNGLSINLAGTGYTLTATNAGLINAVSTSFDIIAIVNGGGNGGGGGGGSGGGGFGGFGGGTGVIPPPPVLEIGTTSISGSIGSDGVITTETKTQSPDGSVTLILSKSTRFLTADGLPGKNISMVPASAAQQPQSPANADIIGMVYNLGPNGATFEPPVGLTFIYDDAKLPNDITAQDLKIAFWDETANKWINIDTENIDTVNHTVTAEISHFSTYSVLGYIPTPAQFTMSAVTISPLSVKTNEPVNVAITVSNIGGTDGSYTVVLRANGVEEGSQTVLLGAGAKAKVAFSMTKDTANTYILDVNGQSASFIVTNPPLSTTTQIEEPNSFSAPKSSATLPPIVTEIETSSGLTTQASIPPTALTSAPIKTMRLSLYGEVIAATLVLIGFVAIIILARRRYLRGKD